MARLDINAPDFQRILSSGFTQEQFITWMKDNFAACGFPTPVETVGSNPKIIAYNLDLTSTGGTIDNYWYVFYVPTITNGVNFTVYHGLFQYSRYNTTTFTRTVSFTGARDHQSTASQLPGNSQVSLNNNNTYTAYNFPLSMEFKGVGLRTNSTGNLTFFFGVALPETINSHINRTTIASLALVETINAVASGSFAVYGAIAYPIGAVNAGTSHNNTYIKSYGAAFPAHVSHLAGGVELITSFSTSIHAGGFNNAILGKYSNDIAYGALGTFPFGTIIEIAPTEQYFVMSSAYPGWAIRLV